MAMSVKDERGAAAVEFALVALLLITIVLGAIEFGRLFLVQSSLTNAARLAARTMAVEASTAGYANPAGDAKARAVAALSGVVSSPAVTTAMVDVSPASCPATVPPASPATITVTITYPYSELTGFFPQQPSGFFPNSLTGKASAQCGG